MSAITKTKGNKFKSIPLDQLVKNTENPNKMTTKGWDLLVDNIQKHGITEPLLVRPIEAVDGEPRFRIVGGHHRFDGAQYLGFEEVPCVIITDPEFDEEQETFQLVRMNLIHGELDAKAFTRILGKLKDKYDEDFLQDAFGFEDEVFFQRMIGDMAKALPDPALKKQFKEAAKDIKTIDGLTRLLNHMFTTYGDTLAHGYMVFDYNNQQSVWLQLSKRTLEAVHTVGHICADKNRTMDDLLGKLVQLIASGDRPQLLDDLVGLTPHTKMPKNLQALPTKDFIEEAEAKKPLKKFKVKV